MFQDYFCYHIKPVIRETTEPYEILDWYIDSIEHLLKDDYQYDLKEFMSVNKHTDMHLNISIDFEYHDFHGFSVDWIDNIPKKYQLYFRKLFYNLKQIGIPDIWVDYIDCIDEVFELEQFDHYPKDDEEDKKEKAKAKKTYLDGINAVKDSRINFEDWNYLLPKVPEAKNKEEQRLVDVIQHSKKVFSLFKKEEKTVGHYTSYSSVCNGYLDVPSQFLILESYQNASKWIEYHVFEQFIDVTANQVGIAPWTVENEKKKPLDLDDYHFEPMYLLSKLSEMLFYLEKDYGKIKTD